MSWVFLCIWFGNVIVVSIRLVRTLVSCGGIQLSDMMSLCKVSEPEDLSSLPHTADKLKVTAATASRAARSNLWEWQAMCEWDLWNHVRTYAIKETWVLRYLSVVYFWRCVCDWIYTLTHLQPSFSDIHAQPEDMFHLPNILLDGIWHSPWSTDVLEDWWTGSRLLHMYVASAGLLKQGLG